VRDIVVVALVIVGFAWLVTMHVVLTFGLARRTPRWRALVAFAVPPLAPYFAWREHMRTRVWLWIVGIVVYLVALTLALRG
jgi:hypothetical protein